jgi:hypothetical protein
MHTNKNLIMHEKGGLVMVRQFKETSIEGKRLLHLGMAVCMLLLVMVICHAEPVFAKNFEMDLDANKVTYTLTEAKSGEKNHNFGKKCPEHVKQATREYARQKKLLGRIA